MFTALRKIKKTEGKKPDDFEKQVAQAIFDLEVNSKELKADLQPLTFLSAKEANISKQKKAIVIVVPERQIQGWRKIQVRLVRELEKKFSGKHVIIIAQRNPMKKPGSGLNRARPRKRTLQQVRENLLEDVCYPVDIVGKRTRVQTDGRSLEKVYLDPKEKANYENKLVTFSRVYRMLTGQRAVFAFPPQ